MTDVPIKQISAGTTHSITWCSAPPDSIGVTQQKPFVLDIHEETFGYIHSLLQQYASHKTIQPFSSYSGLVMHAEIMLHFLEPTRIYKILF